MYKTIDLKEKSAHLEARVRAYWKAHQIPEKSVSFREGNPQFVFYEGPPTANGRPGIHHMMSRTLKDIVCRYKTMRGFQVKRKAGWDTHGLPVEIEVEKELGLSNKKDIEAYGIEPFNKKCKESVFKYESLWREMTNEMGYWLDMEHPYITLQNNYIESVWWLLSQMFRKGLIYKGYKIVPYCPSCGTPLSSHEVAQGYRDVEDPSVFVKFKSMTEDNTWFLAWTTTPWTLISNVALAVHPKETYVKVKHHDQILILAKARLSVLDGDYEIISEFKGKTLEHHPYEPLFRFVEPDKKAWYVGLADYVTMEDGTGIVHTAPAFGQDDYTLALKYDLPFIQPVNEEGKFNQVITPWAGIFVKTADKDIIRHLKDAGNLYKRTQVFHSYPHCWRCESPLIYYARDSWYIRTSEYKELMKQNNASVNWYPPFVGEKRFGEWLENNVDWALSRDRFWGTPLNIWICDECGKLESISSIAELREKGRLSEGYPIPEDIELHKPYIDCVELKCPACSAKMHRTSEVIDCWFDSGAMPFAQWHYPFENKDIFESELFPADFISEGIDQTRGWFYTLLAISTMVKGISPFRNCLVNDLILDKNGIKMSKSKGNTLDPMQLMQHYGADAIRWYLMEISNPWLPKRFDPKGVEEIISKFMGTMKNVYSFYVTYANIDNFDATKYDLPTSEMTEIDTWIISRLNSVIKEVTEYNENYDFTRSVRLIQDFVQDEISNWYVRRSRRRFWAMELTDDKKNAYIILHHLLTHVCRLIAPFTPYIAEDIYSNLTGKDSVHLTDYPSYDESFIKPILEKEMRMVIDLVSLGRAARNTCQIKVRQTLQALYIPIKAKAVADRMSELIHEEINVKEIRFIKEHDDFVQYEIKPNFKVMGPKFGKQMKLIADKLTQMDAGLIMSSFQEGSAFEFELDGTKYSVTAEDLQVTLKQREGYVFEQYKDLFVALDTSLTSELIEEGYARELVNKIQFTRKEQDFDILDRIEIEWYGDDEIEAVFKKHGDYIREETLAKKITRIRESDDTMKIFDINGKHVVMRIDRIG
jgi:isoleucyl-tRNA synthetase